MPYDGNQSGGAPRPKHEVHSKFLNVLAKSPPPVPPLDSLTKTSTPVSSHPLAQCSVDPAMLNSRSALLYRLRRCNTSTTVALESVLFRPPSIPPRHRSLDHQRCIGKHTVSLDGLTSVGSAFASLRFPVEAHWKFACRDWHLARTGVDVGIAPTAAQGSSGRPVQNFRDEARGAHCRA